MRRSRGVRPPGAAGGIEGVPGIGGVPESDGVPEFVQRHRGHLARRDGAAAGEVRGEEDMDPEDLAGAVPRDVGPAGAFRAYGVRPRHYHVRPRRVGEGLETDGERDLVPLRHRPFDGVHELPLEAQRVGAHDRDGEGPHPVDRPAPHGGIAPGHRFSEVRLRPSAAMRSRSAARAAAPRWRVESDAGRRPALAAGAGGPARGPGRAAARPGPATGHPLRPAARRAAARSRIGAPAVRRAAIVRE